MPALKEKLQKLSFMHVSLTQAVGLGIILVALAILCLALSSSTRTLTSVHETQRILQEQGRLHMCEVELERAKSGQGMSQCQDDLKKTRASLAAALGVSVGDATVVPTNSHETGGGSCKCPSTKCPPVPACEKQQNQDSLCPSCPACASCNCKQADGKGGGGGGEGGAADKSDSSKWKDVESMDVPALKSEIADLRDMAKRLIAEKARLENQLKGAASWDDKAVTKEAMESAKRLLGECNTPVAAVSSGDCKNISVWKGYECKATDEELQRYLNYTPRALCPQDWYLAQKLRFMKDCFSLPRRRCLSITPPTPQEPVSFPQSLFDQAALKDSNVRWDLHQCKSFECLNSRQIGDCRNCFNLQLEERRWKSKYRGSLKMSDVIALKQGTLRLGLDVGGGTGSFAAHMAQYNVTVMTTALNVETVPGRKGGLPYMEAIALRGLIPLHVPHKARLPLFDGTLDIIHSVNSVKYLPPLEFEELLFEWDRVLRAGGIMWFEMFYAPVSEMPVYVQLIELLGYKKLYWNYTPKPDAGEREGEHVYLNCVIEKPARPGNQVLDGPPEIDSIDMM